jgi:hypothetical protein
VWLEGLGKLKKNPPHRDLNPRPSGRHENYHKYNKEQFSSVSKYAITTQHILWLKNLFLLYVYVYTGCPRRNVPDFGRVFLMLKYAGITLCPKLNGYGDNGPRKVWSSGGSTHCTCQLTSHIALCSRVWWWRLTLAVSLCASFKVRCHVTSALAIHVSCIVLGTLTTTMTLRARFFVVQFSGFTSLTS